MCFTADAVRKQKFIKPKKGKAGRYRRELVPPGGDGDFSSQEDDVIEFDDDAVELTGIIVNDISPEPNNIVLYILSYFFHILYDHYCFLHFQS